MYDVDDLKFHLPSGRLFCVNVKFVHAQFGVLSLHIKRKRQRGNVTRKQEYNAMPFLKS